MSVFLILVIAIVLMLINMPIAFAIAISSTFYFIFEGKSLMIIPQAMTGAVDSFPLLAIPLFMLVGLVMNMSGVTKRIFNFATSLVGHFPGGLGHVNVVASIIFAGMSGSATADAAGLGTIEIEAMKEDGFDAEFSAAVTAASSTIGPIIPPSMPMIIYGTILGVSVGRLFLGGFIPGLLMGLSLMILIYFISVKRKYPVHKKSTINEIFKYFFQAILPLMTPVILIGGIVFGIFTPTEAAGVAAIYAIFLGIIIYHELTLKHIIEICVEVALVTGTTLFILATAFLFVWIITINHVPETILNFIQSINLSKIAFLFIINIFLLFVGTLTTVMPAVILFGPILAPVILGMGIDPVHFGVIFVLNLMIGLLTPPVGPVLFVMSNITGLPFERIAKACFPFIIPLVVVLLLITYVPAFVLWLPNLLMGS
ncbi:Sialic acid TRAP transporter large permease protein SiaM [subsurface metagenome]